MVACKYDTNTCGNWWAQSQSQCGLHTSKPIANKHTQTKKLSWFQNQWVSDFFCIYNDFIYFLLLVIAKTEIYCKSTVKAIIPVPGRLKFEASQGYKITLSKYNHTGVVVLNIIKSVFHQLQFFTLQFYQIALTHALT